MPGRWDVCRPRIWSVPLVETGPNTDYASCPTTRRSVSGICVFFEEAVVSAKSVMQKIVALSVTESETIAAV